MRALALFEWRLQTRRLVYALAALGFAGACALLAATGQGPDGVLHNGPWNVAAMAGLLSLPAVLVATVVVASAALRDDDTGMAPLVHAAPLTRAALLFGRFGGAMAAAAVVVGVGYVVLAVLPFVVGADQIGPFRPGAYLWAFGVVALPNLLVAGAALYGVAALTRSSLATWVTAIGLYVGYFGASLLMGSPMMAGAQPAAGALLARGALLDPFGVMAVYAQTRTWTPEVKSVEAVALTGLLLANRLLWLGAAAAGLAFVHARWRPDAPTRGRRRVRAGAPAPAIAYAPVRPRGGAWTAFAASLRQDLRFVATSRPLWVLAAGWAYVAWEVLGVTDGAEYGTRLWPTTGLLLGQLRGVLLDVGAVAVVYVGAELAWRDRTTRMDALLDATAAPDGARFAARAATLVAGVAVLVGIAMAAAAGVQHAEAPGAGPGRALAALEPGRHLAFALTTLVPLALLAVAVLAVQVLVPNRYAGLLAGAVLAVSMRRGPAVGLEHPMLRFADGPVLPASAFGPNGHAVASFVGLMAFWAVVAAALAVVAPALAPRGPMEPLRRRVRALPARLGASGRRLALGMAVAVLAAGGWTWVQTTVVAGFETSESRLAWRADYERAYARIGGHPEPRPVALRAAVDLRPERQAAEVAGTLRMVNRTAAAIDTVWVTVRRDLELDALRLDGAAPAHSDVRYGMHAFARALAPGDTAVLAFRVRLRPRGLSVDGGDRSVVGDGTYLTSMRVVPEVGYLTSYEIEDARTRRRLGLPPRAAEAEAAGAEAPIAAAPDPVGMTLDLTVSTAPGQTAVAPGELVRRWTDRGRPHARFVTSAPVTPVFAVASARYVRHAATHGGVTVEVYAHPDHGGNVPRMLRAAVASLDVLGAAWGPYPRRTLRIAEVPAGWPFAAFAFPGLIAFTENRGFLTDPSDADRLDLVSRRVAHEVAHQWWGHTARPTGGPGDVFIVETMAKYGEQKVVRALHGEGQVARLVAYDRDRYARGRTEAAGPEPPLTAVTDESHLFYGKGAVVMNGLHGLVGARALDAALATLMRTDRRVTPADWRAAVRAAAPALARPLVDDWVRRVVLYDLGVERAVATPRADGRYDVAVHLRAARTEGGRPLRFDETLDLGLYAGDPAAGADPTAVHPVRVRDGRAVVRLVSDRRPAFVVVDPFVRRVDVDPAGHVAAVEAADGGVLSVAFQGLMPPLPWGPSSPRGPVRSLALAQPPPRHDGRRHS